MNELKKQATSGSKSNLNGSFKNKSMVGEMVRK
jgi:hypothetical protein